MKRILAFVLVLALALPVLAQSVDEYKFSLVPRRPTTLPANSAGYLLNDGTGTLSYAAAIIPAGTIPLTAAWTTAFPLLFPDGTALVPSISFASDPDTGFYYSASALGAGVGFYFVTDGVYRAAINQSGVIVESGKAFLFSDGTKITLEDSNIVQFNWDTAAPADFTLKVADGLGTDKPGGMYTHGGGCSTGTGTPGGWRVQTSTIAATGSTKNTYYDRIHAVGKVYSLTNNNATALFSLAVADGQGVGGKVDYTIEVTDGTDVQVETGTVHFAAVNKATETWTSGAPAEVSLQALSSGTLATTWAADTATADTFKLTLNSNSSLTPTSTLVRIVVTLNSPRVLTIL